MDRYYESFSLSYPQKSIWHMEKMYPGSCIGNVAATLRVALDIDYSILEKAINKYINANDALRLRMSEKNGEPKQYLSSYEYKKLEFFDFSKKDINELYKWDKTVTRTPFYNTDSDLFYFAMIKIKNDLGGFYVKLHHTISDAWTLVSLGNEIMGYYEAMLSGNGEDYKQKPSYLDFIRSETEYLSSERFKKDEEYWLGKFEKIPELTTLKGRKTSADGITAKRKTFMLPVKLSDKIRSHCRQNRSSIFSLYMAALSLYFNRTKGEDEIIFGTPVLNRSNAREKNTTGMFINTVPIRANIDDSKSYLEFSEAIGKEWLSTLRHQKYPYLLLLKKLRAKNPWLEKLYDIVISYQNAKVIKKDKDYHQEGRWHFNGNQTESLNIHINDREADGNIIIDYDYLADLFYAKEIDSLHDHVIRLLWHSIDNPARKLPDIEMISESEKEKILNDFNDTASEYPFHKTIDELFKEQAKKTPDAVSYVYYDKKLTYRELDQKSDELAMLIKQNGFKKGQMAAVLLNRTLFLPISILAIIKAGGAYLPIDPDYPEERIRLMLKDSGCSMLVTDTKTGLYSKALFTGSVIFADKKQETAVSNIDDFTQNKPDDTLYVIYTSGSTGVPKGVMVSHKNVVNLIYAIKKLADYENKTVLSKTTVTFDVFVLESFLPLLNGSKIILTNDQDQKNHIRINDLISEHGVQIIHSTPSRLKDMLIQSNHIKAFKTLETITTGGEVLTPQLLKKIKSICDARVFNVYGPTETTVYSTFADVTNTNIITIGKPISNTKILILDKHKNLLPIGINGDLYVSGDGVAKGYLNKKALTNEKFTRNGFFPDERMYKTGDIARWYPKGDIEFIGRQDHQIKIRGLRIELDEIKSYITSYDDITDAVVDVRDNKGKKIIAAYIVCDKKADIKGLKQFLSKHLPGYMIPAYFIQIDSIPLNSNGKANLGLLPDPDFSKGSNNKHVQPSGHIEKTIADKWRLVLNIDDISVHDDFFEFGGDSLSVTQLLVSLDQFGIPLTINDIYMNPTIKKLSSLIQKKKDDNKEKETSEKRLTFYIDPSSAKRPSLTERIQKSELPKLDSGAITYIPMDLSGYADLIDEPILFSYIKTDLGNTGLFILPISGDQIYNQKDRLIKLSADALCIAKDLGAGVVSLTGLIPSVTSYGYDIKKQLENESCPVKLTTGHTTTAASVVLSVERILDEYSRSIEYEKVAFVGLGSVGTAVIGTLLSLLPHPGSIILCDIAQRKDHLKSLADDIKSSFGFSGSIEIALSIDTAAPDLVYDSTLMIGATNTTDVIDIKKLLPGTIIVDDSGPHCFSVKKAVERLLIQKDILFTEGGVLKSSSHIEKIIYLPDNIKDKQNEIVRYFNMGSNITGCVISGLLSDKYTKIAPVLGKVMLDDCIQNYKLLKKLGYTGADLHCDYFQIPHEYIFSFRDLTQKHLYQKSVFVR